MKRDHILARALAVAALAALPALGCTAQAKKDRSPDERETQVGYQLSALAGLEAMPWTHFGFITQLGYTRAPALANLIGDTHDTGGVSVTSGLRVAF